MPSDFAKEVQDAWNLADKADDANRKEALADLRFAAGEHWDSQVRQYREEMGIAKYGFPLPCLTINTVPQYINQVVGDRRANEVAIKVLPNEEGDKQTADVRSELIRSIEVRSKAQRVYMGTFQSMVNCGISNLRVDLDYAYDDAFERDLFIRDIPNPLAVLWDPRSADPTGRDAEYCFVSETITRDEFKRKFKDASESDLDSTGLREAGWIEENSVRITEYWTRIEKDRMLALMQDGSVQDVTDKRKDRWLPQAFVKPDGSPFVRKSPRKFARMVVTNGHEELSDPFELPLHRLPIIRASGQMIWVGDKLERFGLVRFARDPARLKDYWRSVVAEMLMLAPRANYMADAKAIEGREDDWPNTLIYNEGSPTPIAITQQHLAAMMREAEFCSQDIRDTTGIHEADLGMQGNEKSGIAIQRRQQQGDIASIVYHDHMNAVQQEAGEVLNDLLPVAYDTARTIRLIGQNEAVKFLRVNDPLDPEAIDLSKGRYDVTITTGPAYMTKRVEGAAQLVEIASKDGGTLMKVAGDKVIQSLDIVDGDEIAERYKRTIPPEVLGDDANDDKSPEELQRQQAAAQEAEAMKKAMFQLELRTKTAEAEQAEAQAIEAKARAAATKIKPMIDGYNAETGRLKAVTAKDFPLPPEAVAILAPVVTRAVMDALASPDVLPLTGIEEAMIAEGSLREAAEGKIAKEQEQMQPQAGNEL